MYMSSGSCRRARRANAGVEICVASVYIPHATSSAASFEEAVHEGRGLHDGYDNMSYGGDLNRSGTQAVQCALNGHSVTNKCKEFPARRDPEVCRILGVDGITVATPRGHKFGTRRDS